MIILMHNNYRKKEEVREMAWEPTEWACGHTGSMQLYGKMSGRDATVAYEAGRPCMACWLIEQWRKSGDTRYNNTEKRWDWACAIAEGKGKRIHGAEKVEVK
ncbi:hypothetical protein M0R72_13185 [Candidatus Pacearchaeota archaeon]|nr:hypothetical protein [Candidatus Pacearchaeota archaeon]